MEEIILCVTITMIGIVISAAIAQSASYRVHREIEEELEEFRKRKRKF